MVGYGRLEGKVAIITGAASGIGEAASILFSREGANVVMADLNEEGLESVKSRIVEQGGTAIAKQADVSDESQVKGLIAYTLDNYQAADILCNNAGIVGDISTLEQQDGGIWQKVYGVNVLAAVYATKYIVPHMKEKKCGAIVNIASVAGVRAGAGGNAYSASKAALINFTKTSACDLGLYNIRVNAVCPGLIETGMTKSVFDYARDKGKEEKLGSRCELRRYGKPHEIANAMLFLASDEAKDVNGQVFLTTPGALGLFSQPEIVLQERHNPNDEGPWTFEQCSQIAKEKLLVNYKNPAPEQPPKEKK